MRYPPDARVSYSSLLPLAARALFYSSIAAVASECLGIASSSSAFAFKATAGLYGFAIRRSFSSYSTITPPNKENTYS